MTEISIAAIKSGIPQFVREGDWSSPKSSLVTIYGDQNGAGAQATLDSCGCVSHLREACLAPHRMLAVCGRWAEARPYDGVVEVLRQAQALAEADGWQIAAAIDGALGTGAVINDLEKVAIYPEVSGLDGFNAAHGFVFECEKPDMGFEYSDNEVAAIEKLAKQVLGLLSE